MAWSESYSRVSGCVNLPPVEGAEEDMKLQMVVGITRNEEMLLMELLLVAGCSGVNDPGGDANAETCISV